MIPTNTAMGLIKTVTLTLLIAVPLCAQGSDTLIRKDGRRDRGIEITSMTVSDVTFRKGSEQFTVPSHLVASVEWAEPPDEFALAAAQIARGEFANAAELYAEAANKTSRALLQVESRFLAAEALVQAALLDASKAADASATLQQLLQENPDAYQVPNAKLNLGRALRLGGEAAEAERVLRQMEDEAMAGNWSVVWNVRAKYERAQAQLDQGKAPDARSTFRSAAAAADSAIATGSEDPDLREIKMQSLVGEGETFLREKNYTEAVRFFRGLGTTTPLSANTAVLAAAKAGEGEALFLQAEETRDTAILRRAQIALAESNLLDTEAGDTSAKSAYYMARTILALGTDGESESFRARANGYFQIVVDNYPGSTWSALAREALEK